MPRELQDRMRQVFPGASDSLALGYGSTECTALATLNFGENSGRNPTLQALPFPLST